jgi:hypothetical protein
MHGDSARDLPYEGDRGRRSRDRLEEPKEGTSMPLIMWLLGVPLSLIVILWLIGVV